MPAEFNHAIGGGGEPKCFTAGDSLQWVNCYHEYQPADGWSAHFAMRGANTLDAAAAPEGNGFKFTIPDEDTTALTAGEYFWQTWVTNGTDRITLGRGRSKVLPDLEQAAAGYDDRSEAEIILAAIDALILGKATKDQQSYSVAGRQLSRYSMADLITARDKYQALVNKEKSERAMKAGTRLKGIRLRF